MTDLSFQLRRFYSGALYPILVVLNEANINIEYMYGLSIESDDAYVVLKASDTQKIDEVLAANGIHTLSCEELANL